jgi:hypothetical protein
MWLRDLFGEPDAHPLAPCQGGYVDRHQTASARAGLAQLAEALVGGSAEQDLG